MFLEWVNYASFVLDYGGVRLITDPWLEGKVFNHGWSLLSAWIASKIVRRGAFALSGALGRPR